METDPPHPPSHISTNDSPPSLSNDPSASEHDTLFLDETPEFPLDLKQIAQLQKSDPAYKDIILHLENPSHPPPQLGKVITSSFCLGDDNELYYISEHTSRPFSPLKCLAIPKTLQPLIISLCHDAFSHNSVNKTITRVKNLYYWPSLHRDIENYVSNCLTCVLRNTNSFSLPSGHLPVPVLPMLDLSFDILHMTPSHENYTKILGVTDQLTSYLCLYPLKQETSEAIADVFLTQHIPHYGFMRTLHSDSARVNTSEILNHIFSSLGIKRTNSTPNWSQGNSIQERNFRNVNRYLSTLCHDDPKSWPKFLGAAQLTHNTSFHSSLQDNPFFLTHGFDAHSPTEMILGSPQANSTPPFSLSQTQERLLTALARARQNLIQARIEQARASDLKRHAKNLRLDPGTPVCLKIDNFPTHNEKKLSLRFAPDYVVVRMVTPFQVEIQHRLTGKVKRVHPSKLKLQPNDSVLLPTSQLPTSPLSKRPSSSQTSQASQESSPPPKLRRSNRKRKSVSIETILQIASILRPKSFSPFSLK